MQKEDKENKGNAPEQETSNLETRELEMSEVTKEKEAGEPKKRPQRPPLVARTYFAKTGEVASQWHLVDATGANLGRLASKIAVLLMGKHKPQYTPFSDTGDFVVVVNAEKVALTGNKWKDKMYYHHTNYAGGIKSTSAEKLRAEFPERLIENAVWGMLPKSKGHMVRHWFKKLRVFKDENHTHSAQKPQPISLG